MSLKIDVKFDGKLTCAFENGTRNSGNFHSLRNSDFTLESDMLEPNKNSKQPNRPDTV